MERRCSACSCCVAAGVAGTADVRLARRVGAALLLVALGRLLSPAAVPVYDGLGAPDEPYRYVARPSDGPRTADATVARASSPLVGGRTKNGMSVTSAESGPQVSVYLPPKALAATGDSVVVTATPLAPQDAPRGTHIDGNVYEVRFQAAGPVSLTEKAALAQILMRATTARQPPPVMEHRASATAPWEPLKTFRSGNDVYVASFREQGQYALVFSTGSSGSSSTSYLVLGGVVLLVVVVVVVRLRAAR